MSSVSAPSGAPLAAAALPTPEEVRGWRKENVMIWATVLGLDDDDAAKLVDQKIDGAALLEVTQADLLAVGMLLGPAGKIVRAVAAIKNAGGTAPTGGGAGAGACG